MYDNGGIVAQIRALTPQELEAAGVIEPARVKGWICPLCESGSGEKGTGMRYFKAKNKLKCFSCGAPAFSMFDLIALKFEYDNTTEGNRKTIEKAKELFHLKDDKNFVGRNNKTKSAAPVAPLKTPVTSKEKEKPVKDHTEFFRKAQNNFELFINRQPDKKWRGFPLEEWRKYGAGVVTVADLNDVGEYFNGVPIHDEFVILPYNNKQGNFFMRAVVDYEGEPKRKRPNTGCKGEIYNPLGIDLKKFPRVAVVEGHIDAFTIEAASKGQFPAIAVGGVNNLEKLVDRVEEMNISPEESPCFVFIADQDKNKAGENGARAGVASMRRKGYPADFLTLEKVFDSNDFWINDPEGFVENLNRIIEKFNDAEILNQREIAKREKIRAEEYENGVNFDEYFRHIFKSEVSTAKNFSGRKSGFENLDKAQIFFPGLYVIGGLPATGKTTFMWQLLEQMARNGNNCIYCSYEMSKLELFTKSLTRNCFEKFKKILAEKKLKPEKISPNWFLTSAMIRRGIFPEVADSEVAEEEEIFIPAKDKELKFKEDWQKIFQKTLEDFEKAGLKNLRVIEMQDDNIDDMIDKLKKFCSQYDKPPIVCIDYLQIIPTVKETTKAAIDDTVRKLKNLQRETGATVFIISSFNRENYKSDASFQSFKESGNIEYSADVVWGLQFHFGDDDKERSKATDVARKEVYRPIQLKCLKNRNGSNYEAYFSYNAACDTFISSTTEELETIINKITRQIDNSSSDRNVK